MCGVCEPRDSAVDPIRSSSRSALRIHSWRQNDTRFA